MLSGTMSPEKISLTGSQEEQERQRGLVWIEANRDFFWLVATVASEQTGRGVLLVDMTRNNEQKSLTFGYIPEGALTTIDERQRALLHTYNPQREFIISLFKPDGRTLTYLGQMPEPGWWEELPARTPYPPANPDFPF